MASDSYEDNPGKPERLTGNRKFVVLRSGEVVIGKADEIVHPQIAERLLREGKIDSYSDVVGGGVADCDHRRTSGASEEYGTYDKNVVRKSLEGWEVLDSSKE